MKGASWQEIEAYFAQRLSEPMILNISNDRNWSFASEICGLGRHENAHSSYLDFQRDIPCNVALARSLAACSGVTILDHHLRGCQDAMEHNYTSLESSYCAVVMVFFMAFHDDAVYAGRPISFITPKHQAEVRKWCTTDDYENVFSMARQAIASCSLLKPIREPNCFKGDLNLKFANKMALLFTASIFDKSRLSHLATSTSTICWEPDLQAAQVIIKTPGRWDVDAACVRTLQTELAGAVKTMAGVYSYYFFGGLTDHGVIGNVLFRFKHEIAASLAAYIDGHLDALFQAYMYPSFDRFLRYADQRQQDKNSNVTVSCKGLRSSRDEVYDTTLQLLRLVLVFYLQDTRQYLPATLVGIAVNNYLPCFLDNLI